MLKFYQKIIETIKSSQSLCYVYYDEKHYYPELYKNIEKLNFILHQYSVSKIALYVGKSFYSYCGIFGILLSGNTWIPFDPKYPEKRNLEMLKLAIPNLVLTDREMPETLKTFLEENNIRIIDINAVFKSNNKKQISMNNFLENDIAYIMFTSGSTGTPKGVPMTNGNYINFINNVMTIIPFEKQEVFSDFHEFGFDISIFYLFCCVLTDSAFSPFIKEEEKFFPVENMIQNNITIWSSVPSVISRIKSMRPYDTIQTKIKIMFICGEPFYLNILKYCYDNMKITSVYNFYGLTETGVENFYHCCSIEDLERFKEKGYVPIGKPLPGNDIKVTSDNELLISGCQITPGYLGLNKNSRIRNINNTKWFYTGDVVEKFEDVYFCKGRIDSQVKLGGFRVELLDIEAHIKKIDDINDAVCFVKNSNNNNLLICAIESTKVLNEMDLIAFLKNELPKYMIPKKFIHFKLFPRNKNGKIDRKKIKEMV